MQARDWEKRPVQTLLRDFAVRDTASNDQLEKPMQKYDCLSKSTARHMTSWSTRMTQSQGTGLGQAGWKACTRNQWSPQSHNLQPDHGGRSTHTCNTVASLSAWRANHTCHHSHRLNEPPAKGRVWNGLPRLAHSHAQSSATNISVDLLSSARRSQWE